MHVVNLLRAFRTKCAVFRIQGELRRAIGDNSAASLRNSMKIMGSRRVRWFAPRQRLDVGSVNRRLIAFRALQTPLHQQKRLTRDH